MLDEMHTEIEVIKIFFFNFYCLLLLAKNIKAYKNIYNVIKNKINNFIIFIKTNWKLNTLHYILPEVHKKVTTLQQMH